MSAGTAYIDGVVPGRDGTGVVLLPSTGRRLVWLTNAQPDHEGAVALRRAHPAVFTVSIAPSVGGTVGCNVLVGTADGAKKLPPTLEIGLAFCAMGMHGTVRNPSCVLESEPAHHVA